MKMYVILKLCYIGSWGSQYQNAFQGEPNENVCYTEIMLYWFMGLTVLERISGGIK